jgi:hypothetical protein
MTMTEQRLPKRDDFKSTAMMKQAHRDGEAIVWGV